MEETWRWNASSLFLVVVSASQGEALLTCKAVNRFLVSEALMAISIVFMKS